MPQLRLVYSNGKRATSDSPKKSRMLSAGSAGSLPILTRKLDRLSRLRPAAVSVVAKLVDDFLSDYEDESDHRGIG